MPTPLHLQRTTTSTNPNQKHPKPTYQNPNPTPISIPENLLVHHTHTLTSNQCTSTTTHLIPNTPIESVWSIIKRFDKPHAYKHFLKSCNLIQGQGEVGTLREVRVVSGMPAESSTERLEIMDEEKRVMSFKVVGGEHRLRNYTSVTSLHARGEGTVVVESYVVDVPDGNTKEETCAFVDTIVRCNLQSLAQVAGRFSGSVPVQNFT